MRILIATDAWYPQVNGVVRTLDTVAGELRKMGEEVRVISTEGRRTLGMPSYPEIRLAYLSQGDITRTIRAFAPNYIHIATEGPIGYAMRWWCLRRKVPFTTGFHTRFPEYLAARIPLPGVERMAYALLKQFHKQSRAVLAPTKTMARDLTERGFANVRTWTRGVDHDLFRRRTDGVPRHGPGPVMIYAGRVAIEKGLEDFLRLDLPGTKVVIGDGPSRQYLEAKYPETVFTGYKFKDDLTRHMSAGDVFVFPSKTDTFGLVMAEAMACGLPVAAFPVTGPIDVVEHGVSGWLDEDLSVAIKNALGLSSQDAQECARQFSWPQTARQLRSYLCEIEPDLLPQRVAAVS